MKRNRYKLAVGLLMAAAIIAIFFKPYLLDWLWHPPARKIASKPVAVGSRTLLIAPHPDDEALGAGGLIQRELAEGKQVKVVIVTCGDGYGRAVKKNFGVSRLKAADYRRLGEARHLESLRALQHLGVKGDNVFFFGYPDSGVSRLWEYHWDKDNPYRGRNGSQESPYSFSYEKRAPYFGANVEKNLIQVINSYKPTDIIYPDPNDQHPDHWATNAMVKYVLTTTNYRAKEFTYLVHRGDYPWPWNYEPNVKLKIPYALRNLDTYWDNFDLKQQEVERKTESIYMYTTQTRTIRPFMEGFIRKNELFGVYNDPVLTVIPDQPDLDEPRQMPYRVFRDPSSDSVFRELETSADITAVGAVLAGKRLYLGVQTRGPVRQHINYNIRLRLFRPDGVERLELTAYRGSLTAKKYAGNSIGLPTGAGLQEKGGQLWITLPAGVTEGVTGIFISADTFVNNREVDKTAWRLLRIRK